jgi:hypothetical protein
MKGLRTLLAESRRAALDDGTGAPTVCVLDGSGGCTCGCLEEETGTDLHLSRDEEIDLLEEFAREGIVSLHLEDNEERRLALDSEKEDNAMSNIEKDFEKSLESNAHYQEALREATDDEAKARVATYRSNLRARFVSARQHEEQSKAREQRKEALREEAEERIAREQYEAEIQAEMQRVRQGVAA